MTANKVSTTQHYSCVEKIVSEFVLIIKLDLALVAEKLSLLESNVLVYNGGSYVYVLLV